MEEKRQYCYEVELLRDQIEEVKGGGAIASKVGKEVSRRSSDARMVQQVGTQDRKRKFFQTTKWSIERMKDKKFQQKKYQDTEENINWRKSCTVGDEQLMKELSKEIEE